VNAKSFIACDLGAENGRVVLGNLTTALGNLLIQAVAAGELGSQTEIREIIRNSVNLEIFSPSNSGSWPEALARYRSLVQRPTTRP
jgi:rhamnulokinase